MYYPRFRHERTVRVVNVSNCRGLDQVNKQGSVCTDETLTRPEAVGGKAVGATEMLEPVIAQRMLDCLHIS